MEHNIKPSEIMKPSRPSPLPLLAIQTRKHLSKRKTSTIDPFLEGYITASIEQGQNYSEILNKCATKGYEVSKKTIDQFMNSVKRLSIRRKSSSSSSSTDDSNSMDSDSEKNINVFEMVSRGTITILNLLFFMVSALLIAFGCMVKYGSSSLLRNLEPIFDSVQKISAERHYPLGTISITHLILEAATIAIILGAIMLAISFFGWCGACCRRRAMLVLYCALLTFILALQVTIVILLAVMRSRVDLALKKPLKETLVYQYRGIQGQDSLTVSWNYVMNSLKCCGVEGYEDFDKSRNWDRIYHDPHTMRSVHLSIPMICCQNLGDYPEIQPPKNFTCAVAPDRWNSNYKTGCYGEIWNYISGAELMLAGIMMCATILQMMLIFASVYLISRIHHDPEDEEE